jgi:hypothetical protein
LNGPHVTLVVDANHGRLNSAGGVGLKQRYQDRLQVEVIAVLGAQRALVADDHLVGHVGPPSTEQTGRVQPGPADAGKDLLSAINRPIGWSPVHQILVSDALALHHSAASGMPVFRKQFITTSNR